MYKKFSIFLTVTFLLVMTSVLTTFANDKSELSVYVNGTEINFTNVVPANLNGVVYVPLREVFDSINAKVNWDNTNKTITITNNKRIIIFTINSNMVLISDENNNTNTFTIKNTPIVLNNHTLLPLREAFNILGGKTSWDDTTKTINIILDVENTNDEIKKPVEKETANGYPIEIGNKKFKLGMTKDDIDNIFGTPKREKLVTNISENYTYATYYNNYEDYVLIGYKDNVSVYAFSNNKNFKIESDLNLNYKVEINLDELDKDDNFQISHIKFGNIYNLANDEESNTKEIEQQNFDIVNVLRAKRGLTILTYNEKLSNVARNHSIDMMKNNYFDHYNLNGESPFDRIESAGFVFMTAGENLVAGNMSSMSAYCSWLLSTGHRETMLSNTKEIGVGFTAEEGSYKGYMTQLFITQK